MKLFKEYIIKRFNMSQELKNAIQKYVEIDNKMNKIKELNKSLKKERDNIDKYILNYMNENNMQNKNIILSDGKLRYVTTKSSESITKKYIQAKLGEFFNDKEKAKEATDYIYDTRSQTESVQLKRSINKKKSS